MAAITIDFNELEVFKAYPSDPGNATDVEFGTVNGSPLYVTWVPILIPLQGEFPYTPGLQAGVVQPHPAFRADFRIEGVNWVSVELTISDPSTIESLFLTAYTATGNVSYTVADLDGTTTLKSGTTILEVSANNISYVIFGARSTNGEGNMALGDNFTYSVVPAPGALALAAAGVTLVQGLRRKRLL